MRRDAMLLALAALPLTGCAVIRERVRVAVKGCVDVPYTPPTGIRVFARTLRSRHVRGPVAYVLAVAEGVDPHTIDRAIYVLPGRAGTAGSIFAGLNCGTPFAAAMRTYPVLRHAVLVSIDAGDSYFHPRSSGENRLALVTEELPNAVAEFIGARSRFEALTGMSMGGYGALLAAEREPARYRAVAVAGPAIFPS